MELRALRAFVEVVRQGGFSQAAKVIFATQSTVSKAVKQFEEEIGAPLLDRHGHPSRLTPAGDIVYRRALKMLAERDDLVAELDELRGLKRGILRLGLPPVGSSTLFAPLFASYRSRYPGIDIRLVEHGSTRLEEILLAGEIELGASLLPVPADFEWQDVRSEPMMVLLPAGQALAAGDVHRSCAPEGPALHPVRDGLRVEPGDPRRLPAAGNSADHRRPQQPDRLHRGARRHWPRYRLPAADDRRAASPSRGPPGPAGGAADGMAYGDDLAARQLSLLRRQSLARARARGARPPT